MKKLVIALVAFSSLMVLSCRQQEEMMDSEDIKSLSVLQEAKNKVSGVNSRLSQKKSETDSIVIKTASRESLDYSERVDLDKMQPPK